MNQFPPSPEWATTRGVTRLDGAQDKKQIRRPPGRTGASKVEVWRPYGQIWVLSKANLLYWRKYLWHCWDFSAPPAVIRRAPAVIQRPHSELAPGELGHPCPPRYAPGHHIDWKSISRTNDCTPHSHPVQNLWHTCIPTLIHTGRDAFQSFVITKIYNITQKLQNCRWQS